MEKLIKIYFVFFFLLPILQSGWVHLKTAVVQTFIENLLVRLFIKSKGFIKIFVDKIFFRVVQRVHQKAQIMFLILLWFIRICFCFEIGIEAFIHELKVITFFVIVINTGPKVVRQIVLIIDPITIIVNIFFVRWLHVSLIIVIVSSHLPLIDWTMLIDSLMNNSGLKFIWITLIIWSIIISLPSTILSVLIVVLVIGLHLKRSIRDIVVFVAMRLLYSSHLKRCIYVIRVTLFITNSTVSIIKLKWSVYISLIKVLISSTLILMSVFIISCPWSVHSFPKTLTISKVIISSISIILVPILYFLKLFSFDFFDNLFISGNGFELFK